MSTGSSRPGVASLPGLSQHRPRRQPNEKRSDWTHPQHSKCKQTLAMVPHFVKSSELKAESLKTVKTCLFLFLYQTFEEFSCNRCAPSALRRRGGAQLHHEGPGSPGPLLHPAQQPQAQEQNFTLQTGTRRTDMLRLVCSTVPRWITRNLFRL